MGVGARRGNDGAMTEGTLSTLGDAGDAAIRVDENKTMSYDPSKVAPVHPGTRSSITSMSVIFIAPSFVAPVCAIV
jgi:hypothetical protein